MHAFAEKHIVRACPAATAVHQHPLTGTVPADPRQPLDVRTVLANILDASEFQEFKALFGTSLLTGFGRLYGQLIGVLANDGVLQADSALKGDTCLTVLPPLA